MDTASKERAIEERLQREKEREHERAEQEKEKRLRSVPCERILNISTTVIQ